MKTVSKEIKDYLNKNYSSIFIIVFLFAILLCVLLLLMEKYYDAEKVINFGAYSLLIGIILKMIEVKIWKQ